MFFYIATAEICSENHLFDSLWSCLRTVPEKFFSFIDGFCFILAKEKVTGFITWPYHFFFVTFVCFGFKNGGRVTSAQFFYRSM